MHYYKRNIGDYHKKAGRLTMLEHGAYTLLIDACYDREQFPTLDEAIDWAWARSDAEVDAVKFVLSKFFTLIDGRYVQNRVQEEVEDYKSKADTNSRIAQEREARRRAAKGQSTASDNFNGDIARTVHDSSPIVDDSHLFEHEPPPNQEPLTTNQEPLTNLNKKNNASATFEKPVAQEQAVIDQLTSPPKERQGSFVIDFDWQPSAFFKTNCLKAGKKPEAFTDDMRLKFITHYQTKGFLKTVKEYDGLALSWLLNDLSKPVAQQTAARGVAQQPQDDVPHYQDLTKLELPRRNTPEEIERMKAEARNGAAERMANYGK